MIKISTINKILLFFYPIFFALPDLAINVSVINLRYDDLVIYLLFLLNFIKIFKSIKDIHPYVFYYILYFLFIYAFISFLVTIFLQRDYLISSYEIIRSFGSLPYLFVLPYMFNNVEYRKVIYFGTIIGGGIYIYGLIIHYQTILKEGLAANTSASMKKSMSFSTLNPNAVATLAVLLGWMNIFNFTENKNKISLFIGIFLLFVPVMVFARAVSFASLISIFIFIILQKNKSLKVYFLYLIISVIFIGLFFYFVNLDLLQTALDIDVSTGKGFSNRYTLWAEGIKLIQESPFFGYGFGTEHGVYIEKFHGHMSHEILLHYSIELGVANMLLFLFSIFYLFTNRLKLYNRTNNIIYLLQITVLSTFFIADLAGQLLYFNKYAFLVFTLSSFYIIKKEKNVQVL